MSKAEKVSKLLDEAEKVIKSVDKSMKEEGFVWDKNENKYIEI